MYFQYLSAVLKKAFQPARGVAELLQLLVAFLAPALSNLASVAVPTGDSIFAYLGMAVAIYVGLRLFFVAPFLVWQEHMAAIGELNQQLAEPERAELAHMASIRAEKRLELAATLREFHWLSFEDKDGQAAERRTELYGRMLALMGQAGVPDRFWPLFADFSKACRAMNRPRAKGEALTEEGQRSADLVMDLTSFLHGRLSAEALDSKAAERPDEPELPLPATEETAQDETSG